MIYRCETIVIPDSRQWELLTEKTRQRTTPNQLIQCSTSEWMSFRIFAGNEDYARGMPKGRCTNQSELRFQRTETKKKSRTKREQ